MDLDALKTAWQQQVDEPSSNLQFEVTQARRTLLARDWTETFSWTLLIVVAVVSLQDSRSVLGQAGLILTIASSIGYVALLHVTRIRSRAARMDAALQAFCRQERERLDSSIRQRRLQATWYLLPPAAGLTLWLASLRPSALEWILSAAVAACLFLYSWWMSERKIRNDLLPLRDDLDRQLRELESNGSHATD